MKQNDEQHSTFRKQSDEKINKMNAELTDFGYKFNQKINAVSWLYRL